MAEDEESQIAEDFGRMVRIATGSALQVAEARSRRSQVTAGASQAERRDRERMEANAARVVQHDLYRNDFWKNAGSESIADRMSVAASLADRDPAAQSAWMHGADTIRNTYGVDVERINREHPGSLEERHAALRDALDDRLQMNVMDARADQERARENAPGPQQDTAPTFPLHSLEHERDTVEQLSKDQALTLLASADRDELMENLDEPRSTGAHVQKWIGRDADVDAAIAAKVPEWVGREAPADHQVPERAEQFEAEADRAAMEGSISRDRAEDAREEQHAAEADTGMADTSGLAARRDFARERAEERQSAHRAHASQGERVDLDRLEAAAPGMAQTRIRQLQSFALNPEKALEATKQHGRRDRHAGQPNRGREEVLSR